MREIKLSCGLRAGICVVQYGRNIYLGSFVKLNDADITYRQAEVKYFEKFARESSKLYVKVLSPEYQMSLAG